MIFVRFGRFFELYSILAEKQCTKTTNSSFLNFSASFDTHDAPRDGLIVEWKKFSTKMPLWAKYNKAHEFNPNEVGMMLETNLAQM